MALTNPTENRRRFTRYSIDDASAWLVFGEETLNCSVVDESIGGLGLIVHGVPNRIPLAGDAAEIVFRDEKCVGYFRSAEKIDASQMRVRLSWDAPVGESDGDTPDEASDEADESDESSETDSDPVEIAKQVFYTYGLISVACDVIQLDDTGRIKVRFFDGKTFLVHARQITVKNRVLRSQELGSEEARRILGAIYNTEPTKEAILQHEFS